VKVEVVKVESPKKKKGGKRKKLLEEEAYDQKEKDSQGFGYFWEP